MGFSLSYCALMYPEKVGEDESDWRAAGGIHTFERGISKLVSMSSLAARMRQFETALDQRALPQNYLVARLDGRNFTRLTRELHDFEAPFDSRFRDLMLGAAKHLMGCGFRAQFAYVQSDEISLLLHKDDTTFGRNLRKTLSVLAGEASAAFSATLGAPAAFDCRVLQLPTAEFVGDYYTWRQTDATRNALNAHCYWLLRKQGNDGSQATAALRGMAVSDKHDLLFASGTNFNELPLWQRRGVGLYWENRPHSGVNPLEGTDVASQRRVLVDNQELPIGDAFAALVRAQLGESAA